MFKINLEGKKVDLKENCVEVVISVVGYNSNCCVGVNSNNEEVWVDLDNEIVDYKGFDKEELEKIIEEDCIDFKVINLSIEDYIKINCKDFN